MAKLGYSYRRLVNLLGPERVARGEMERLIHSHDFAAVPKPAYLNFQLVPDFVVLPKTAEEVVRIVKFANEAEFPIVARGGGTGFYGAGVANRGGILVDFRQMRRVAKPDMATRTISAEAGATWKQVADAAWNGGAYLPYVPNLAPASTVGGWINGGGVGIGSYKYGGARENLLSADLVLPDGSLLRTGSDKLDLGTQFANLAIHGLSCGFEQAIPIGSVNIADIEAAEGNTAVKVSTVAQPPIGVVGVTQYQRHRPLSWGR